MITFMDWDISAIIGHPFDTNKVLIQNGKRMSLKYNLLCGNQLSFATSALVCSINFGSYTFTNQDSTYQRQDF